MENLGFYLLILLAGILMGSAIGRSFTASRARGRLRSYPYPPYPAGYERYERPPARPMAALPVALVFLLFLLLLIFFVLRPRQHQTPEKPLRPQSPRAYFEPGAGQPWQEASGQLLV